MDLLSPARLGRLTLTNRVVMAPMTRSRALGNVPNALMAEYYTQRAGAGLIITEGTSPSPNGLGYPRIPGLFSAEQISGWRLVTDAVHAAGGHIVAQLMHTGRIGHANNLPAGARILAPSAVIAAGAMYTDAGGMQPHPTPEVLSAQELAAARDEYVAASRNAIEAGFDGVELHGANGYLMEQFLHPHTNRRHDEYGGSVANRSRFVVETAAACAEAIGADRVGIRLSPFGVFNDLPERDDVAEQYTDVVTGLRGLLYLHLMGTMNPAFPALAGGLKGTFGGPLILNGGFERARAQATLDAGHADFISFGRPFISNPDLVARMASGAPLAEPNAATFYMPGAEGYTDYPAL